MAAESRKSILKQRDAALTLAKELIKQRDEALGVAEARLNAIKDLRKIMAEAEKQKAAEFEARLRVQQQASRDWTAIDKAHAGLRLWPSRYRLIPYSMPDVRITKHSWRGTYALRRVFGPIFRLDREEWIGE